MSLRPPTARVRRTELPESALPWLSLWPRSRDSFLSVTKSYGIGFSLLLPGERLRALPFFWEPTLRASVSDRWHAIAFARRSQISKASRGSWWAPSLEPACLVSWLAPFCSVWSSMPPCCGRSYRLVLLPPAQERCFLCFAIFLFPRTSL